MATDPYAGAPKQYKHPNDRKHFWEGLQPPPPEPETPAPAPTAEAEKAPEKQ